MKNIIALVFTMFPVGLYAQTKHSFYCDNIYNEFQHTSIVKSSTSVARHREGFLNIAQSKVKTKGTDSSLTAYRPGSEDCMTLITSGKDLNHSNLVARLHFEFDRYDVSPMASSALHEALKPLASDTMSILIDGHTDNIGSKLYNQELGLQRAVAISDIVQTQGIKKENIVVRSFGQDQPIAQNTNEQGQAMNRRAEISVLVDK